MRAVRGKLAPHRTPFFKALSSLNYSPADLRAKEIFHYLHALKKFAQQSVFTTIILETLN